MTFSNDFLGDFFGRSTDKPRISDLSKNTVRHDRWDREDYEAILNEMREFSAAEDRLTDAVSTGSSAFADTFFSLMKASPEQLPASLVRPAYQVNHAVMSEAMDLTEWEEMRMYTPGDTVATGLAAVAMEPDLELLFDKVKTEQELAEKLDQQMQQMEGMEDELRNIDEMMEQLESGELGDPSSKGNQQKAVDYQAQKALIEAALERLRQEVDEGQAELKDAIDKARPEMRQSMKQALKNAIEEASDSDQMAQMWGLDPGTLHRLPADQRIELARRLKNERFKRIAQLFGPMHRMAFAEQQRKTIHSNDEIYDVESGSDLARLLSSELMTMRHPMLRMDFYRKFFENSLLQYKLRGEEKLAKGGIICCEDGSGSMHGDPEIWAKAVGLTLLQIAKSQNRSFFGIHFGGVGKLECFDFRNPKDATLEQVISYAEIFFGGGTDFMTPLSKALDLMREEHAAKGAVKADIVFITDGQCGVSEEWLAQFKEEQERLSFKVYGVIIGGSVESDPLNTICDGRVLTIKQLHSGEDLREVFRGL